MKMAEAFIERSAVIATCLATLFMAAGVANASLLSNGDFNSPSSTAPPDDWTTWTNAEGGWANHEILTTSLGPNAGNYDGSYQMSLGGVGSGPQGNQGGGVYQVVSASAGAEYTLSVDGGAEAWWWPTGEIRLFFLDASDNELASNIIKTTDGITGFDQGVVYQPWSSNCHGACRDDASQSRVCQSNGHRLGLV